MKIAIIGTGYVGLVSGTCFAETGNEVTCVDIDAEKVERLRRGEIPIYEPGLEEMVMSNVAAGRLHFTTDLAAAVKPARLIFLAVGTPSASDGSVDLTALRAVVTAIAPHLSHDAIVVTKSTVPVGVNREIFERLLAITGRECDVASNPEFLKEGAAIDDFMYPDRVVVGVRRPQVADVLRELYSPYLRTEKPFLAMSPESAEMTKYVANSLLATKISFINEMANLTELLGADINDVRRGIGHDSRIGFAFLFPGVGYGGSCFPKDIRGLVEMAKRHGGEAEILSAVDAVNHRQSLVLLPKIEHHFQGDLVGKTIAVWGLAFKPRTDDIREAPALKLIERLQEKHHAQVRVHDPEAMPNVRREKGDAMIYCDSPYDALDGADALVIMTEWKQFVQPNFDEMKRRMKSPTIFDGRNIYNPPMMREQGFTYYSIGRATVRP